MLKGGNLLSVLGTSVASSMGVVVLSLRSRSSLTSAGPVVSGAVVAFDSLCKLETDYLYHTVWVRLEKRFLQEAYCSNISNQSGVLLYS